MSLDHQWMYAPFTKGILNWVFMDGLETFTEFAYSQPK